MPTNATGAGPLAHIKVLDLTVARLARISTSLRRAAPAPGADTDLVLRDYGYTPEEIATLKASSAVGIDPLAVDNGKGGAR